MLNKTGPLSGGTTVTIEGAGFKAGATVEIGGVPASSVNVVNATRIEAVVPARASFGSVAVKVTNGEQAVQLENSFAYLNPLGANMELVGQIGGDCNAVAVVGNLVFSGEGTSFVVHEFSNVSAPAEKGRITLPSMVDDIVVIGNKAFVADKDSGLYVLDVSNPTSPSILGFYDFLGSAQAVAIDGSRAYVATGQGLEIVDISDPAAIVRLGGIALGGNPHRVALGNSGSSKLAFVAQLNGGVSVIDVTHATSLVQTYSISSVADGGVLDIKVVGNRLYMGDFAGGVRMFEVNSPSNLTALGTYRNGAPSAIDVTADRLYQFGSQLRVVNVSSPATPSLLGYFDPDAGSSARKMTVANGIAFVTLGRDGLMAMSISNPGSMSVVGSVRGVGRLESVAIDGNHGYLGGDSTGFQTVDLLSLA